ncbi:MAG: hypothetical protein PPFGHCPK_01451 (plasmid) [Spiroplasma endosymbiont of Drosophila atripex]|nr:MAG: hypothetical protein PPFGHCPK_01451 [Spiroplasma endosymbiont of Drosophila atripex]
MFFKKQKEKNKSPLLFNFRSKKSQKHKDNSSQELVWIIQKIIQKIGIIFAISFLPIFFLLVIILAVIIAVWHFFHPDVYMGVLNPILNDVVLQTNLTANDFVKSVIEAMSAILYVVFIQPILWLLNQFQVIVDFIGGGTLNNKILFNNSDWHGVPILFFTVLGISLAILLVLLSVRFIEIKLTDKNMSQKINSTFRSLLLIIPVIVGIPIAFYLLNSLINSITTIIIKSGGTDVKNIGLFIFNSSFTNGLHHFKEVPDSWGFSDSANFGYFQCLCAEGFMVYILLQISAFLFVRVAEQVLLLIIGTLFAIWMVQDEGRKFRNWKDLTMNRFISFSMVFVAYTIFLNSISALSEISNIVPSESAKPIFTLIGTFGFGITVIKAPQLLGTIFGGNIGLADGIGNLMGLKASTGAFVSGTKLLGKGISLGTKAPFKAYSGVAKTTGIIRGITSTGVKETITSNLVKEHKSAFENSSKNINKWLNGDKDKGGK